MNWFECKVSSEKMMENGMVKKVTESYLVDALSHAEAEARIITELEPYIRGEFIVTSVRRVKYAEVFQNSELDYWWRANVSFITLDERSGAEKRTNVAMLVGGNTIEDAIDTLHGEMKGTMADYRITGIKESNIWDIFVYAGK